MLLLLVLCELLSPASSVVYSSVVELENLHKMTENLTVILEDYLEAEYYRLSKIQEIVDKRKLLESGKKWKPNVENPIDAFRVVRNAYFAIEPLKPFLNGSQNRDRLLGISIIPVRADVDGGVKGVIRLMDNFKITANDFARGFFKGIQTDSHFTAEECFEIGVGAYRFGYSQHSGPWLFEGFRRLKTMENTPSVLQSFDTNFNLTTSEINKNKSKVEIEDRLAQERLCAIKDPFEHLPNKSQLYSTLPTQPLLRLFRVGVTYLSLDPEVLVLKNIIFNREMEAIKNYSIPMLMEAAVFGDHYGYSEMRVNDAAFLSRAYYPEVKAVEDRLSSYIGIGSQYYEHLQVAVYGLAGYYGPHYDYLEVANWTKPSTKREVARIATMVTYLSTPELGGQTIFTDLGIVNKAEKGDALMWYNFHLNGSLDERMVHAGCPVLLGSKWIGNKWFHYPGGRIGGFGMPELLAYNTSHIIREK